MKPFDIVAHDGKAYSPAEQDAMTTPSETRAGKLLPLHLLNLSENATPGEWKFIAGAHRNEYRVFTDDEPIGHSGQPRGRLERGDAEFAAACVNYVRSLAEQEGEALAASEPVEAVAGYQFRLRGTSQEWASTTLAPENWPLNPGWEYRVVYTSPPAVVVVDDAMVQRYVSAVNDHLGALTAKDWEAERLDPAAAIASVARIGLTAALEG